MYLNAANNQWINLPVSVVDNAFNGLSMSGLATRAELARVSYPIWRYMGNWSQTGPMSWGN
jgi:hypothetical protein